MWNLLGERPVDACYWESFGKGWKEDTVKHLGLKNTRDFTADYGMLPDLEKTNPDHDILFTFNGTTSGVRVPNLDWISDNRQVLTHPINAPFICFLFLLIFSRNPHYFPNESLLL